MPVLPRLCGSRFPATVVVISIVFFVVLVEWVQSLHQKKSGKLASANGGGVSSPFMTQTIVLKLAVDAMTELVITYHDHCRCKAADST